MSSSGVASLLFGEVESSVLWAASLGSREGQAAGPTLFVLPERQFVFLIPVTEQISWRQGTRHGEVAAGSLRIFNTGETTTALEVSASSDAIVVGMRLPALASLLEPFRPGLAPSLRELLEGRATGVTMGAPEVVPTWIIPGFRQPPVSGVARAFWYESQFKALLSLLCFVPARGDGEFFCSRQKRLARVRVAKAKARLEARLDENFDLNRLAAEVGCSSSYLSRTFSTTVGMTISQYLRKRRIETAAELIVTGRCNVSEAAVEVGYQSLSHFSKAFQQVKGCLPSRYEAA